MSVQQDRFTFFGVLIAVVIVVLGYLQIAQLYPVAGRGDAASSTRNTSPPADDAGQRTTAPREGDAQP
jgi:Tfp pilus assembly protein PilV